MKPSKKELNYENIFEYGLNVERQELFLFDDPKVGYLNDEVTNNFLKSLSILNNTKEEGTVVIHLKSSGGDVENGIAICDALLLSNLKTVMCVHGYAYSMASVILQLADKRVLLPSASIMIHDGYTGLEGSPKAVSSTLKHQKNIDKLIVDIYLDRMIEAEKFKKKSRAAVLKSLREKLDKEEDFYLSAPEAIEWGLADEVLS